MNRSSLPLILLLLPLLQMSCLSSTKLENGSLFSGKEQTEPFGLENLEGLSSLMLIDSTIAFSDTATILSNHYQALVTQDFILYIIANQQDTVFAKTDLPPHQEFIDFNSDGYKDLAVYHGGNGSDRMEIVLFDPQTEQFVYVENFADYPAPKAIPGTPYFYSYNRSGCADQNWDSNLFYLQASKAVSLGNISGKGCEGEEKGIYVNRLQGNDLLLLEKFPMEILDEYKDYKWGFIEDYWHRNWGKFVALQED